MTWAHVDAWFEAAMWLCVALVVIGAVRCGYLDRGDC